MPLPRLPNHVWFSPGTWGLPRMAMPNCSAHEGVARAAEDLTVVRRLLELGVPTTCADANPVLLLLGTPQSRLLQHLKVADRLSDPLSLLDDQPHARAGRALSAGAGARWSRGREQVWPTIRASASRSGWRSCGSLCRPRRTEACSSSTCGRALALGGARVQRRESLSCHSRRAGYTLAVGSSRCAQRIGTSEWRASGA